MRLHFFASACFVACSGLVALTGFAVPSPGAVGLRVSSLFGDGVVLQRDTPLPIWGTARSGTRVAVTLAGQRASAIATARGTWRVVLPPMPAGGPHSMNVSAGTERLRVERILVGDVWLAAGQSNMEWKVADATNAANEIAAAGDSALRSFKVRHRWSDSALAELPDGEWDVADRAHVGAFSAVAYFFAREVRAATKVPVGLIDISWGGSAIETWMDRQANGLTESGWRDLVARERDYQRGLREALTRRLGLLPSIDSGLVEGHARWADTSYDDAAWTTIAVPLAWERAGLQGLDGVAWYRINVTLSAREVGQAVALLLGAVDDADVTWINGVEVGRTDGYAALRLYRVPSGLLREGRNTIAVRVTDGGGDGGITGGVAHVYLDLGSERKPLAGAWRFKVAVASQQPDEQHLNKLATVAFNGMVSPLRDFPIRGVIWYQGESNANSVQQAAAYRAQFTTLITSWRQALRGSEREFPFLWVQLPNFGVVDSVPPDASSWATLRESQSAALQLPKTAQVISLDVGDPANIHPRNKVDVGRRLALSARAIAHGESVEWRGPTYRRHSIADGVVTVEFDHAEQGLVVRGDGHPCCFAVAGDDRQWAWAEARLDGSRVVLRSDRAKRPVAVRYDWSNSPAGSHLYSRAELPAAPFRTDRW